MHSIVKAAYLLAWSYWVLMLGIPPFSEINLATYKHFCNNSIPSAAVLYHVDNWLNMHKRIQYTAKNPRDGSRPYFRKCWNVPVYRPVSACILPRVAYRQFSRVSFSTYIYRLCTAWIHQPVTARTSHVLNTARSFSTVTACMATWDM